MNSDAGTSSSPGAENPRLQDRHNRQSILGFEFLWGIAIPFTLASTMLAGYLNWLGAPRLLIGLAPAVFSGGIALVQPFSLYLIPPGPKRFSKMLWAYRIGSAFFVVMGMSIFLLPLDSVAVRIVAFFVCYALFVLIAGSGDPHYIAFTMASVDDDTRGWFFGLRTVYSGIGGLLAGLVATWVLRSIPPPFSFGICISLGGTFIILSTVWFARARPAPVSSSVQRLSLSECLGDAFRIARGNRAFRLFIAAAVFFTLAQGSQAFVALSIRTRMTAGDSVFGILSALDMVGAVVFSLALGKIGDRFGHKSAFITGIILYCAGQMIVLQGAGLSLFAGYLLVSCWGPTWFVAAFNVGYDNSGEKDGGRVSAAINIAVMPIRVIAPLAAGAAADKVGYPPVLVCAAASALVSFVFMILLRTHKS